jgi:plastocyanin
MEDETMNRRTLAWLGGIALVAAACSSGGPAASAAGSACTEATGTGAVAVSIKDFMFEPAAISAKVGDVITFTNAGAAPHTATLDAGGCTTPTLQPGSADGLKFTVAGTYPFHCTIHTQMKGTITVGA